MKNLAFAWAWGEVSTGKPNDRSLPVSALYAAAYSLDFATSNGTAPRVEYIGLSGCTSDFAITVSPLVRTLT